MQKSFYENSWFCHVAEKYTSGWVAISADFTKVVLSGKTLQKWPRKQKGSRRSCIISRRPILCDFVATQQFPLWLGTNFLKRATFSAFLIIKTFSLSLNNARANIKKLLQCEQSPLSHQFVRQTQYSHLAVPGSVLQAYSMAETTRLSHKMGLAGSTYLFAVCFIDCKACIKQIKNGTAIVLDISLLAGYFCYLIVLPCYHLVLHCMYVFALLNIA